MRHCDQCEVLRINGILCHEIGCPASWRSERRECKWCGTQFHPSCRGQDCCCQCCAAAFAGRECDCADCTAIDVKGGGA
jgi:hypothetical protein